MAIWKRVDEFIKKGDRQMARGWLDQQFQYYYDVHKPRKYKLDEDLEKNVKGYDTWQRDFIYKIRQVRKDCFPKIKKRRVFKKKEKKKMDVMSKKAKRDLYDPNIPLSPDMVPKTLEEKE